MAIVETVNEAYFHDAFRRMDRLENFTYQGRNLLFNYLDSLSEDIGEPIELDVIDICCEYSEMTADELVREYGNCNPPTLEDAEGDEDEHMQMLEDWLNDQTTVVGRTNEGNYVFVGF